MTECDWAEFCNKQAEYYITTTPEFIDLFLCREHLIEYIDGLLLSQDVRVWHFDIARLRENSKAKVS